MLRHRLCKCLHYLFGSRLSIPRYYLKTLLRTYIGAVAALYAVKPVYYPGPRGTVHLYGPWRTVPLTEPAAYALVDPYYDMSPHALRKFCRLKGIFGSCRIRKQIFHYCTGKRKYLPFKWLLSHTCHLSVQLMQGSIVSISSATSASWQPLISSTIGGMLEVVGVRSLKRSIYFVPLAFT